MADYFYDTLDEDDLRKLDYKMRHEIRDRYRVQFTNFLKVMVHRCADHTMMDEDELFESLLPVAIKVYNSEEFKEGREILGKYCIPRTSERRGHLLLSQCFNKAFELLKKEEMPGLRDVSTVGQLMIFHPNNPVMLTHTYSTGYQTHFSPDLCVATQGRVYEKMAGVDSPAKIDWPDVICATEARLMGEKGFSLPPQEYTEADAKDVKVYYALQDKHIYRRNKCASECLLVTSSQPDDAFKNELDWSDENTDNGSVRYDCAELEETQEPPAVPESKERVLDVSPNSQITLYARELLCRGIYSVHSINLLIVDDLVWIWWFDGSNVIQTTGLNFVKDMPYFMMLLAAFQRFTLRNWGVEPDFAPYRMFLGYGLEPGLREVLRNRWFGKDKNDDVHEKGEHNEELREEEEDNDEMEVDDSEAR